MFFCLRLSSSIGKTTKPKRFLRPFTKRIPLIAQHFEWYNQLRMLGVRVTLLKRRKSESRKGKRMHEIYRKFEDNTHMQQNKYYTYHIILNENEIMEMKLNKITKINHNKCYICERYYRPSFSLARKWLKSAVCSFGKIPIKNENHYLFMRFNSFRVSSVFLFLVCFSSTRFEYILWFKIYPSEGNGTRLSSPKLKRS